MSNKWNFQKGALDADENITRAIKKFAHKITSNFSSSSNVNTTEKLEEEFDTLEKEAEQLLAEQRSKLKKLEQLKAAKVEAERSGKTRRTAVEHTNVAAEMAKRQAAGDQRVYEKLAEEFNLPSRTTVYKPQPRSSEEAFLVRVCGNPSQKREWTARAIVAKFRDIVATLLKSRAEAAQKQLALTKAEKEIATLQQQLLHCKGTLVEAEAKNKEQRCELEARVEELEQENKRLEAAALPAPAPPTTAASDSGVDNSPPPTTTSPSITQVLAGEVPTAVVVRFLEYILIKDKDKEVLFEGESGALVEHHHLEVYFREPDFMVKLWAGENVPAEFKLSEYQDLEEYIKQYFFSTKILPALDSTR